MTLYITRAEQALVKRIREQKAEIKMLKKELDAVSRELTKLKISLVPCGKLLGGSRKPHATGSPGSNSTPTVT